MSTEILSDLEKYFKNNNKRLIHKWLHYFEVYERHFNRYRGKDVVMLEIGVSQGGSLQMWKEYFGPGAKIYGIDVNPNCKELEEENIEIFIGSQDDRDFLRETISRIPPMDILLDDGGHRMQQQIITFEELFSQVKKDGVYLCEDVCTSYWPVYGGGLRKEDTFIEYTKNLIDYLNAYHSREDGFEINEFTQSAHSMHYYDSMVVIEKKIKTKPYHEKRGNKSFD